MYSLLRQLDGNTAMMGKVFNRSYRVQQAIAASSLPAGVKSHVEAAWTARWQFFHHPLHGAGYALDPEVCACSKRALQGLLLACLLSVLSATMHDALHTGNRPLAHRATTRCLAGLS